jgi:DNA-binding transcriptional MerR regulator
MQELRVEALASRAGLSVEVVRSWQSRGLLPPPRHEGRVAWYGQRHLDRLQAIRDLKARGHSLRAIKNLLDQGSDIEPSSAVVEQETLTLVELAERTRVPPSMLRSLEASGILRPQGDHDQPRYTTADVRAVRMLLSLLGGGVPMEEFMEVAKDQISALQHTADGAVEMFLRYIREPLLEAGLPQKEEAERLVAAFRLLMQAVSELLTYNFQRRAIAALHDAIDDRASRSERAALRRIPA